jgi:hypothetical protein
VRDYGRGIPLGKVIDCVSKINTGGKFNDDVFQFSVGLNGIGTKAVNALSSFVLNWVILSLTLTIVSKLFKVQSTYKSSFTIMGYSMITFVFMQMIFGVFYLSIAPMQVYIDKVVPESSFLTVVALSFYVPLLLPVWSIILAAIGMKETFNLGLATSAIMAVIGFIPYYALYLFA